MGKFKKIMLAVLISCFAVCAGLAVAACTDKNAANFRKPAGFNDGPGEFNGRYVIEVQSSGGMSLNGVKVNVRKGGAAVASGISKNGIIDLTLEPDVYQLSVDASTLPEGYYLDDEQYHTEADKGDVTIKIPSRVIGSTASSGTVYSVGDVMYDFAYTDSVSGTKYTLSELLSGDGAYKAVMLNFFFVGCSPCRLEFPAIEEAYQAYKDKIAIVALSYQDSAGAIKTFAEQMGLNFHLGYDSAGTTSKFSVSAFPTTVIVDRFGVVATINREGGQFAASYWRNMFNHYTSDNYVQDDHDNDPAPTPTEFTKPDPGLVMPESAQIDAVLTGTVSSGASVNKYHAEEGADKEYSWPWLIKGEGSDAYLDASNAEVSYSFSTLYAELSLTPGDAISYEYNVKTEAENDNLYVLVNGNIVGQHSGDSDGWKEALAVYVANRTETVELAFMYYKNITTNVDDERASVRNLNIRPVRDVVAKIDQQTSVVDGLVYDKNYANALTGGYNVTISKNDKDGYYYVTAGGTTALLLADILNAGFWADKHLGSATFNNPENTSTASSVYLLSFWTMSNYDRADSTTPLSFEYLTTEQTDTLIEDYYLQGFSDNGLMPVNDELIAILNAFVDAMYENNPNMFVAGDEKYAGQWLEFCYYFKHYGEAHNPKDDNDHECYETLDPVKGLVYYNAFEAVEGTTEQPVANNVNVNKILNLGDGGGVKFKFVPRHTGVYLFYSDAPTSTGTDPRLVVVDSDYKVLLDADNDMRYDSAIFTSSHDEFYAYLWLVEGETYYVHGALSVAGDTGKYDMYIEWLGEETVSYLRFASTGDGLFTYNIEPLYYYYLAIDVAYKADEDCYYEYTDDFTFGSKIYIDFVHQNYFDKNGHSLYELIENGVFDFRSNGGANYTATMRRYYRNSVLGKDQSDETYGLTEANQELVNILSFACRLYYEEDMSSGAWEMFACYYEYIGNPANN